ncbi:tubulin polyglutamylase complex subunit 2-like isoform X1 [Saccostrea echinata]|uniref:tubulin polyglutamylase complex subunit 2-like isoform X1 n=1 Tax=Saccostrea echinata TaxID=191078 RepID=UPI002A804D9F|nr:tubulin polyglutamylase complex subunit 2-like isoform X1 [Saccostrea echinata]
MDDLAKTRSLLDQLNVGIIQYLGKKNGISKVDLDQRPPADRHAVLMWEQRNTCFLPEDLKNFYLTTDGYKLTWCVKMDNGPIPLGKLHINRLSQLTRVGGSIAPSHVNPTLADLEGDSDTEDQASGLEKPTFDNRCKVFELDPCDGYGRVCLVFKESKTGGNEPKVEIWFLDRALRWHFLTDSFIAYYRLLLMHLGLPQWQYSLTDIGLCQQAQQWFNMYAPTRLELDQESLCETHSVPSVSKSGSVLDISKVFKGKTDKKKPTAASQPNAANAKKKPVITSAKSQQVTNTRMSASSSQISNKSSK